jgi:hypothetical protein
MAELADSWGGGGGVSRTALGSMQDIYEKAVKMSDRSKIMETINIIIVDSVNGANSETPY